MSDGTAGATPGFLVWRLSMKWRVAVDRALAPLGLTHAQYSVVATLRGLDRSGIRPSQRELADHTGLEALYVSKLARSLEAAGMVQRTRDAVDSRAVRLALTARGQEVTGRAVGVVHRLIDTQLAPLGGTDSERTAAFVRDLTALLAVPVELPAEPPAG